MGTTKNKYAIYRDNTLIASGFSSLVAIERFAREDARREHSVERPAGHMITGSFGYKRVGSHFKGQIHWEDQSRVDPTFGRQSANRP